MDITNPMNQGNRLLTNEEYKELWTQLSPIQVKMVEKIGLCPYNIGDTYTYRNPYDKPQGICTALLHVLEFYIWRVTLGFPSWESDDQTIYRVHCPSKKGTVWEMRKV